MPWKHPVGCTHYKLYKPSPDGQFKMNRQQSPDSGMKRCRFVDQKHATDCDSDQQIDHREADHPDGLFRHIYPFAFLGWTFLVGRGRMRGQISAVYKPMTAIWII